MTLLLYAGAGIALSSCFIHAVLGLGRRFDWMHLNFAWMMGALSVYFVAERQLYAVATVEQGVRISRLELPFILVYLGLLGWFIPRYSGLRIPRAIRVIYFALLMFVLLYDFLAPYGMYYVTRPTLVTRASWGGESLHMLTGPLGPVPIGFYLLGLALHLTGIVGGVHMARQGERSRGIVLATAMALPVLTVLFDLVHEMVTGGGGPYLAEFGVVALSLTMSVQLAVDYRGKEVALQLANEVLAESAARASLLAEATQLLAQPGPLDRSLGSLVHCCMGRLADWCVIDLYEAGGTVRIGAPRPEQERALLQALQSGSVYVVPLPSSGLDLGVLWWVSAAPDRFTDADRELARALAERAASAVVNRRLADAEARTLQRLARVALAVKDMANTPLQTLELSLSLLEGEGPPTESFARMRRALRRLKELESAMTPYAAQIRWHEDEAAFDPIAMLERERPSLRDRD